MHVAVVAYCDENRKLPFHSTYVPLRLPLLVQCALRILTPRHDLLVSKHRSFLSFVPACRALLSSPPACNCMFSVATSHIRSRVLVHALCMLLHSAHISTEWFSLIFIRKAVFSCCLAKDFSETERDIMLMAVNPNEAPLLQTTLDI